MQAEKFAASEAQSGGQNVQGVEPGVLSFGEDALDVTDAESFADLVAGCGDLDEFGDVAGDELAECINQ